MAFLVWLQEIFCSQMIFRRSLIYDIPSSFHVCNTYRRAPVECVYTRPSGCPFSPSIEYRQKLFYIKKIIRNLNMILSGWLFFWRRTIRLTELLCSRVLKNIFFHDKLLNVLYGKKTILISPEHGTSGGLKRSDRSEGPESVLLILSGKSHIRHSGGLLAIGYILLQRTFRILLPFGSTEIQFSGHLFHMGLISFFFL